MEPHFDRFDICEAYFVYASLYHNGQWSKLYAKLGQLINMEFRPSPMLCKPVDLTANGRMIFLQLVRVKHLQTK